MNGEPHPGRALDAMLLSLRAMGRRTAIIGAVAHGAFGLACGWLAWSSVSAIPATLFALSLVMSLVTVWLDLKSWRLNREQEPPARDRRDWPGPS